MKGIISSNRLILEKINEKINNHMMNTVENYNAIQWGTITKHPTLNKFVLIIKDDSRNPLGQLTTIQKSKRLNIDEKEWLPMEKIGV